MKIQTTILAFFSVGTSLLFSCCKDDVEVPPVEPEKVSAVELRFDSRFGTDDFVLEKQYQTASNEQVRINRTAYFISNIELVKADGSVFAEPNSYHLIMVEDQVEKETFKINNVPAGDYVKMRYLVGVDSTHNQTLATATGDLKLTNHMTWMWDTGFVFFNIEGFYVHPDSVKAQKLAYDIGKNRSLRKVELTLPSSTRIDLDNNPKVLIYTDLKVPFGGPNVMNVKSTHFINGEPQYAAASNLVADNCATMFQVKSITQ